MFYRFRKTGRCPPMRLSIICLLQVCIVLSPGCGTFGKTSTFVVHVDPSIAEEVGRRIEVGRLLVERDANVLVTAGTVVAGEFDEEDKIKLAMSLRDSFDAIEYSETVRMLPPWTMDVMVRRHILGHDNVSAGLVTCIAWRLRTGDGRVVYEDEFYGASSARYVGTIGGVKNSVNRAVVERLIQSALLVGAGKPPASISVNRTFDTFSEATESVPAGYQSLPVIVVNNSTASVLGADISINNASIVQPRDSGPRTIRWEELEPEGPVAWD